MTASTLTPPMHLWMTMWLSEYQNGRIIWGFSARGRTMHGVKNTKTLTMDRGSRRLGGVVQWSKLSQVKSYWHVWYVASSKSGWRMRKWRDVSQLMPMRMGVFRWESSWLDNSCKMGGASPGRGVMKWWHHGKNQVFPAKGIKRRSELLDRP